MSGNELKTKCLALVLVCIGSIFITSCSQPKRYTVYIYNPSADALTVYIDNESISVPADSTIKRSLEEGKHLLKTGDVTDTLKVSERKVLINPTRSKVIKKEILYQNEVFGKGKASAEDYFTPLKTIIIDSLRYGGHFVFTDDVMIYNWFFTIGEPI
ncbi:MAG TPA: hypothetical protein VIN08_04085, partial [Ohtaekwangia sp.]|uniref:hypothetical protein n=1 Tax=Ohtaekwangia sp. TaxID=2066019 RepID=UPI002F935531